MNYTPSKLPTISPGEPLCEHYPNGNHSSLHVSVEGSLHISLKITALIQSRRFLVQFPTSRMYPFNKDFAFHEIEFRSRSLLQQIVPLFFFWMSCRLNCDSSAYPFCFRLIIIIQDSVCKRGESKLSLQ